VPLVPGVCDSLAGAIEVGLFSAVAVLSSPGVFWVCVPGFWAVEVSLVSLPRDGREVIEMLVTVVRVPVMDVRVLSEFREVIFDVDDDVFFELELGLVLVCFEVEPVLVLIV
jgi:hypothetical protein